MFNEQEAGRQHTEGTFEDCWPNVLWGRSCCHRVRCNQTWGTITYLKAQRRDRPRHVNLGHYPVVQREAQTQRGGLRFVVEVHAYQWYRLMVRMMLYSRSRGKNFRISPSNGIKVCRPSWDVLFVQGELTRGSAGYSHAASCSEEHTTYYTHKLISMVS